jgi:hypothetical protein
MKEIKITGIFNVATIYFDKYSKLEITFPHLLFQSALHKEFLCFYTQLDVNLELAPRDETKKQIKRSIISNNNLNNI